MGRIKKVKNSDQKKNPENLTRTDSKAGLRLHVEDGQVNEGFIQELIVVAEQLSKSAKASKRAAGLMLSAAIKAFLEKTQNR